MQSLQLATDRLGIPAAFPILQLVLPAGISFYTFQLLSYVIDVYDGRLRAANRLLDYAAYISFFPHLVAGPILRGAYLMPKILSKRQPSSEMILSGLQLALWGYFSKIVIADNMALIANGIFRNPSPNGAAILICNVCVRISDLCRLHGIHQHRSRHIADDGLRIGAEFQSALFRHQPERFLAALAHQSFNLASGLSISGWEEAATAPPAHTEI
jgi:hypothetical protein